MSFAVPISDFPGVSFTILTARLTQSCVISVVVLRVLATHLVFTHCVGLAHLYCILLFLIQASSASPLLEYQSSCQRFFMSYLKQFLTFLLGQIHSIADLQTVKPPKDKNILEFIPNFWITDRQVGEVGSEVFLSFLCCLKRSLSAWRIIKCSVKSSCKLTDTKKKARKRIEGKRKRRNRYNYEKERKKREAAAAAAGSDVHSRIVVLVPDLSEVPAVPCSSLDLNKKNLPEAGISNIPDSTTFYTAEVDLSQSEGLTVEKKACTCQKENKERDRRFIQRRKERVEEQKVRDKAIEERRLREAKEKEDKTEVSKQAERRITVKSRRKSQLPRKVDYLLPIRRKKEVTIAEREERRAKERGDRLKIAEATMKKEEEELERMRMEITFETLMSNHCNCRSTDCKACICFRNKKYCNINCKCHPDRCRNKEMDPNALAAAIANLAANQQRKQQQFQTQQDVLTALTNRLLAAPAVAAPANPIPAPTI
ncbi:hypothetical protein OUZ56_010350 [Daphnia magna]|uniref:Tesmin/TSO1-like CXC domain-containing protein n=1 Tax=Daphnia magna TaxID=35525 RepID=A0ABR0AIA5_9CRUS|nr:hypothetical protein OUZ56_010350 [Daphnia magna]